MIPEELALVSKGFVLYLVGLALSLASVILEGIVGVEYTTILFSCGTTALFVGFILRRLEGRHPKAVSARGYLATSLFVIALGALLLSFGAIENLASGSSLGVPIKIGGIVVYILGIVGMILSITILRPKSGD